jgi:hypothetical protein
MPTRRTATGARGDCGANFLEAAYLAQDRRFIPKETPLTGPINFPTADSIGGAVVKVASDLS